jgi:hydroxymethylpyrimidine kinase/phosphomethylpyrimidine kinase
MNLPVACTVAGSDPSGGAGIQADLRTFARHRVHGAAVLTALTVQDTQRVYAAMALEPDFVVRQLVAVLDDLQVAAVKTGMLANGDIAVAVAAELGRRRLPFVVIDPVLAATSGDPLFAATDTRRLIEAFVAIGATIWTPNLDEAAMLLGQAIDPAEETREAAALALATRLEAPVLLKGGHVDADDCFAAAGRVQWFRGQRVELGKTHGTGCHLSAAIAARLALGQPLPQAIAGAKAWLSAALAAAVPIGKGGVPPWPN